MEWVWVVVASLVIGGWLFVAAVALLRGTVRGIARDDGDGTDRPRSDDEDAQV